ncbi:hypothetical protein ES332_D11G391300v1 [Gossypium tomentosum]|uniref:Uncharacterized protein n=1 Tax=Gossypium tomentosum TaxID=34277 RepID=A0A5D2IWV8_GOSTO|nr:hypothetical protein ES332_D11G391300v1 [Gossypium tomentosum]TYH47148.1 hypothetical protein ES332_D11G391300v1 [Gossypium tomentosum]TYH47150.1 hypothetical protein ES332_D11G391300v1 [Gossypium tomentosum]
MDTGKNRKVKMLEVENVRHGVKILKDRVLRRLQGTRSLRSVLLEANYLPGQIEKLTSMESQLKIIKEIIKNIPSLPEPEAKQILSQVETNLEGCQQQLDEIRQQLDEVRRQQSEVSEKTKKLHGIIINNEGVSTETLRKELNSVVPLPYMKEVAATYDHARLLSREASPSTFSDFNFQIFENNEGLNGIPLGKTITNGTLQQGGSEASEAQYNKNAPPLLHGDGEMGKEPFKMVEPIWASHPKDEKIIMIPTPGVLNSAIGQPLPPDDIQVNCSSSMLTRGKKRKQKAKGKGIKKQCPPQFYSAVPSTQAAGFSTFGDMDIPWENTITSGMLQQGGSEASEAQYNTNTPLLSHSDNQMNLIVSGSNKRDGVSEAGIQGTEMNDVTILVDQDHISLPDREMSKCNYSSWLSSLNKDNNSVEVAHFHGLQEALDKTCCGKTPDYLKHIATQIEADRGKATKFGHKNIEILVCAAIKEMKDWLTNKDSGCNQLKKWAATLNMGKEQDFEVKFADDMLNKICLACYAYSMIYGEDGSAHNVASGRV